MRIGLIALGTLVLGLPLTACKSRGDGSEALNFPGHGGGNNNGGNNGGGNNGGTVDVAAATAFIEKLDAGCATGSCHHNNNHKLTFNELKMFADQTASYQIELEQKNCYAATLTQQQAQACWDGIQGAGGLKSQDDGGHMGGIFQASIRTGIVKKIREAAQLDESAADSMMAMPFSPLPAARDFAADIAGFRAMANFMKAQPPTYAGINAVRPSGGGGGGGDNMACDTVAQGVTALYRPNFRLNMAAPAKMYGCSDTDAQGWPANPANCFSNVQNSNYGNANANGQGVAGLKVKILRKLTGRPNSSFWTRSSADGRFVSTGNGRMEDLATNNRSIQAEAGIDPFYYPDNKTYTWPNMICPQAPLYSTSITNVGPSVAASQCVSADVGVYGSAGAQPDGSVLVVQGYTNNNGGSIQSTNDGSGSASEDSTFQVRKFSGNAITQENWSFTTPFETDFQLAPSGQLVVGRNTQGTQSYKVRVLKPDGTNLDPANNSTTAKICMKGEKPNTSFDNRFVAFHHYSDGAPQDQGTVAGAANIFVYDLKAKKGVRVTNMTGGAKAYFPHWRADGWLYFVVKEPGPNGAVVESIAASNVAFVMTAQNP